MSNVTTPPHDTAPDPLLVAVGAGERYETQTQQQLTVNVGAALVYLDYRSNAVTELRVLVDADADADADAEDDPRRWLNYPWDAIAAGAGTTIASNEQSICSTDPHDLWLLDLTVTVDNPTLARQALVALPVMYTDPRIIAGARRAVLQICDALCNELTGWQWQNSDDDGTDDTSLIAVLAEAPDTPILDTAHIEPAAVHDAVRSGVFYRSDGRLIRRARTAGVSGGEM